MSTKIIDKVYGCLIGGAIGDALGAPIKGWNYWEIREKYGRLGELIASPRANANQKPGGVTDDTALRQYIALAIARQRGRITPNDLAALWLEKGNAKLFWSNERGVYEKFLWGMNPWETGRGANICGTATMAIAPIGIINAGNPAQAYQDGYIIAGINQDGEERDAAGALAAGISVALLPDATLNDVIGAMKRHGSFLIQRAIDLTFDVAARSRDVAEFTEKCYVELIDWKFARPPGKLKRVPNDYPQKAMFYSGSSLEMIPVSLALVQFCNGDSNESIIAGANFGRDCDTIASIVGCLVGALNGASSLRADWIATCESANVDLFEELEGDVGTNFSAMATRLVDALRTEKESAQARTAQLQNILESK